MTLEGLSTLLLLFPLFFPESAQYAMFGAFVAAIIAVLIPIVTRLYDSVVVPIVTWRASGGTMRELPTVIWQIIQSIPVTILGALGYDFADMVEQAQETAKATAMEDKEGQMAAEADAGIGLEPQASAKLQTDMDDKEDYEPSQIISPSRISAPQQQPKTPPSQPTQPSRANEDLPPASLQTIERAAVKEAEAMNIRQRVLLERSRSSEGSDAAVTGTVADSSVFTNVERNLGHTRALREKRVRDTDVADAGANAHVANEPAGIKVESVNVTPAANDGLQDPTLGVAGTVVDTGVRLLLGVPFGFVAGVAGAAVTAIETPRKDASARNDASESFV